MDYQGILEGIAAEVRPLLDQGEVANYIPELARVPAERFGIALHTVDGGTFQVGDSEERFSTQSISKVFTLTLAMVRVGDALWLRVGREPSGTAFNSLVQLEHEQGIPRNPFINAGALVVTDVLLTRCGDVLGEVLELVNDLGGGLDVEYDHRVAHSERATGHRNAALAHFLKSFGNLDNEADEVLDAYFHHCSLAMSCSELARAGMFLARSGRPLGIETAITSSSQTKYINSLLLTCGVYDAAGDFAYRVGLPAKSGVGGGILAVLPGHWTVCVWSPGLDASGNSLAGSRALELLTTETGQSIF
ncbi:MAG: glutaminase [Acidobacteriota bacterium]